MTRAEQVRADAAHIAATAEAVIAGGAPRVKKIEVAGQFYWVKHEEQLTLRMRLQKGDPHRAFEAERHAIHELASAGAPVPPVVAEGKDYFVTPDCGPTLREVYSGGAPDRIDAFRAAGAGLAGFHARGLSHGRPSIKDIAWDGRRATFFDFERYAARRNAFSGHVQDVVILLFSALAHVGKPSPEINAMAEAYRAQDPGGIWTGAERLCRRLRWIDPVTWPVRKLSRSREFRAIPLTLATFGVL